MGQLDVADLHGLPEQSVCGAAWVRSYLRAGVLQESSPFPFAIPSTTSVTNRQLLVFLKKCSCSQCSIYCSTYWRKITLCPQYHFRKKKTPSLSVLMLFYTIQIKTHICQSVPILLFASYSFFSEEIFLNVSNSRCNSMFFEEVLVLACFLFCSILLASSVTTVIWHESE